MTTRADDNEANATAILLWAIETRGRCGMTGISFTPRGSGGTGIIAN